MAATPPPVTGSVPLSLPAPGLVRDDSEHLGGEWIEVSGEARMSPTPPHSPSPATATVSADVQAAPAASWADTLLPWRWSSASQPPAHAALQGQFLASNIAARAPTPPAPQHAAAVPADEPHNHHRPPALPVTLLQSHSGPQNNSGVPGDATTVSQLQAASPAHRPEDPPRLLGAPTGMAELLPQSQQLRPSAELRRFRSASAPPGDVIMWQPLPHPNVDPTRVDPLAQGGGTRGTLTVLRPDPRSPMGTARTDALAMGGVQPQAHLGEDGEASLFAMYGLGGVFTALPDLPTLDLAAAGERITQSVTAVANATVYVGDRLAAGASIAGNATVYAGEQLAAGASTVARATVFAVTGTARLCRIAQSQISYRLESYRDSLQEERRRQRYRWRP